MFEKRDHKGKLVPSQAYKMLVGFTQCAQIMWFMSYLCKVLHLWKPGSLRCENLGIKERSSELHLQPCYDLLQAGSKQDFTLRGISASLFLWDGLLWALSRYNPPRDFDTGKVQRVGFSLVLPSFLFFSLLFSLCASLRDLWSKKNSAATSVKTWLLICSKFCL